MSSSARTLGGEILPRPVALLLFVTIEYICCSCLRLVDASCEDYQTRDRG
ncbi:MAG: hypothetical protein ACKVX7_00675 [Planctomycetota bacterium]